MIVTFILLVQLLHVSQNPMAQSEEVGGENQEETRKGAFKSLQDMAYDLNRLIYEVLKPENSNHDPRFFSLFARFDVSKMVTKLSLDPARNFQLNDLNQLDPHQTFMGGTGDQNTQIYDYLLALQRLHLWPTGQIQHFNKEDFEMPQIKRENVNILEGRDACDLLSCLTSGSIYSILKEFVVNLDKHHGDYLEVTRSDNFFWNRNFFRAMFDKHKHQSNQIVSHEDANYLVLLAQFQTLKELRFNRIQINEVKNEFREQVSVYHRDLENKLGNFKDILTNLKGEIDVLRQKSDSSPTAARPLAPISESINDDIASLADTLELIQADELGDFKVDIQSKLASTQHQATEITTAITKLRTSLTKIYATITSFNSHDIKKEIANMKTQIDPELESISTFTDKMNSEFSTTLKFIQGIHTKTKRFKEYLQKTYVKYGIVSVLLVLGSLISFKLVQIIWKTCLCLVKEINIFYKYNNMVIQEHQPNEDNEEEVNEPPENQLPLINARFRGILN